MKTPKLSPGLSRFLGNLAQRLDVGGRTELYSALNHIAEEVDTQVEPLERVDEDRVPAKARDALLQLIESSYGDRQVA